MCRRAFWPALQSCRSRMPLGMNIDLHRSIGADISPVAADCRLGRALSFGVVRVEEGLGARFTTMQCRHGF